MLQSIIIGTIKSAPNRIHLDMTEEKLNVGVLSTFNRSNSRYYGTNRQYINTGVFNAWLENAIIWILAFPILDKAFAPAFNSDLDLILSTYLTFSQLPRFNCMK
jgi:hypothetical protein